MAHPLQKQQFRCNNQTAVLAVRLDPSTGELYSDIEDIQDEFPGASKFLVDGISILFLQDPSGRRYNPKRIAHFPDQTVEVVVLGLVPVMATGARSVFHTVTTSNPDSTAHIPDVEEIQPFSLQRYKEPAGTHSRALTAADFLQGVSILESNLNQSSAIQIQQHTVVMEQLVELLQLQAEAKERDEELKLMQQLAIDRLALVQQRAEAILTQNYELHEFPIPRLFVILPEKNSSSNPWDPRLLVVERFRLHFLCECGELSKSDAVVPKDSASKLAKPGYGFGHGSNAQVHLAPHGGYEISRPSKFFQQYGPYVLGLLQILKGCVAISSVAVPAISHFRVGDSLDKAAAAINDAAQDAAEAINSSISFLEEKLAQDKLGNTNGDIFKDLDALEGADLRRLKTFLRDSDKDKILGNLYRITSTEGHVKWVCLSHYRTSYQEKHMKALSQMLELNHGMYQEQLHKVTLVLSSSTLAQELYRLLTQTPAVNELDITLKWKFGASDLQALVKFLDRFNIQILHLDLDDIGASGFRPDFKLPGRGKYGALVDIFFSIRVQTFCLRGIEHFGLRMPSRFESRNSGPAISTLRTFHYRNTIRSKDAPILAKIFKACPVLTDLHLGDSNPSEAEISLIDLKKLEVVHFYNMFYSAWDRINMQFEALTGNRRQFRELVVVGGNYEHQDIVTTAGYYSGTLESLTLLPGAKSESPLTLNLPSILRSQREQSHRLEFQKQMDREPGELTYLAAPAFGKIQRLDIHLPKDCESLKAWADILPELTLTHIGLQMKPDLDGAYIGGVSKSDRLAGALVGLIDYSSVKSVYLRGFRGPDLRPLWESFPYYGGQGQVQSLCLECLREDTVLYDYLPSLKLRRLWLGYASPESLDTSRDGMTDDQRGNSLECTTHLSKILKYRAILQEMEVLGIFAYGFDQQAFNQIQSHCELGAKVYLGYNQWTLSKEQSMQPAIMHSKQEHEKKLQQDPSGFFGEPLKGPMRCINEMKRLMPDIVVPVNMDTENLEYLRYSVMNV